MKRIAASAAVALVAVTALSACSGQSDYCAAVEDNAETLNTFGKTRTDAAYTTYAETFRTVAKSAPEDVREDWTALAETTEGVLAAQEEVGLALEDMKDEDAVADLSEDQLATLNAAYEAFNDTTEHRDAVVKHVKTECEITLT